MATAARTCSRSVIDDARSDNGAWELQRERTSPVPHTPRKRPGANCTRDAHGPPRASGLAARPGERTRRLARRTHCRRRAQACTRLGTRENAGIARGSGPRAGKPHLHRPPTRYGRRCRTLPLRAMHQDRLLIPSPAFPPSFYSPRRLLSFRLPCRPSRPLKYLEPNQRSPCLLPNQSSASITRCHTLSMYGPPRPSLRS